LSLKCFNPYFTGCSTSTNWRWLYKNICYKFQSLFYWMFYFNCNYHIWKDILNIVSILILLDVLLQPIVAPLHLQEQFCFNPYFTGCSTSTDSFLSKWAYDFNCFNPYFTGCSTSTFLILYLYFYQSSSFNPYFTGCSTSTVPSKNLNGG